MLAFKGQVSVEGEGEEEEEEGDDDEEEEEEEGGGGRGGGSRKTKRESEVGKGQRYPCSALMCVLQQIKAA